jgi:capsular exopolysaccharide synthesis family protein
MTNPSNGQPSAAAATLNLVDFVRRNRWLVLGVPVAMLVAAFIFIAFATPVYRGLASARIDEDRSNVALLDALQELSSGASIYTEIAELRSRSLAEDIADSLDLHVRVTVPRRTSRSALMFVSADRNADTAQYVFERTSPTQFKLRGARGGVRVVQVGRPFNIDGATITLTQAAANEETIRLRVDPFQAAVQGLQRSMDVSRPDREADIIEIAYESTDRELARDVPNAAARLFIQRRQAVQSQQARSTVAFLSDQIDTLGQQLRQYEVGLQRFREGESVVSLEAQGEAQVSRLADFQADRDIANAERMALAQLMAEIERTPTRADDPSPYRRLIGFPTILSNGAATEILRSLNEVENERSTLLTRRTADDPDVIVLTRRIAEMENQLHALVSTYLGGLTNRIASLDGVLRRFATDLRRIPAQEIQLARLKRQAKVTEDIYTMLQGRMKEAQVVAAVQDPSVRVIDPAILPSRPVRPNKPLSVLLALILGVALGGALAFVKENLDTTIHTREELQSESGAVPVLGLIPRIRETAGTNGTRRTIWRPRTVTAANATEALRAKLVAGRNPRGSASEAYRALRTNLTFARPDKPPRTLVFTSPAPGDGKSTSSSNLAITLAQQGLRIILIDADMRRGAMHSALETTSRPGLSDYLLGGLSLEEVIRPVKLADAAFDFIPLGTLPPNPAELLASTRMQALLEHLEGQYDSVIFDAPPLNVVTDAAILGSRTDGVILVVRAGVTDRAAVRFAFDQLKAVRARVLGCVLNDVDSKREPHYGSELAGKYYEAHT